MSNYSIIFNDGQDGFYSYVENGKIFFRHRAGRNTTWDDAPPAVNLTDLGTTSLTITSFDGVNKNPTTRTYSLTTEPIGGEGNNLLVAPQIGSAILSGLDGNDLIFSLSGNDYLNGGSGDDLLIGAHGTDTMLGGPGNDRYLVTNGHGGDIIVDESGSDTLVFLTNNGDGYSGQLITYRQGSSLFYRSYTQDWQDDSTEFYIGEIKNFQGKGYIEQIFYVDGDASNFYKAIAKGNTGSAKADWISSTATGGSLSGLAGDDVLVGFTAADTLRGGAGNDALYGGPGTASDKFVFDFAPNAKTNVDYIWDFSPDEDKIQFSRNIFKGFAATGTVGSTAYVEGSGKTTADSAAQRLIYNTTTGDLFYDADGNGRAAAVKVAIIGNKGDLSHTDFEIIA
jgi:Ca2+-binding RTX toxin-like protein